MIRGEGVFGARRLPFRKCTGASKMSVAVVIDKHGGPEVLKLEDVDVGEPGRDELRIRQTAIGLNYIDTYHRSGLYPLKLPGGIGSEGAGIVEAIGSGIPDFKRGDRVAYAGLLGGYAEARIVPAARV